MADTQSTVYAQAYGRNIMQLAQHKYAKTAGTFYMKENVTGKTFFQDQIGEWSMEPKAGRNVQTPNNDPKLARRMGIMVDYHDNRMLDRGDELRTLSDPRSAYTIAAGRSIARRFDDSFYAAARGDTFSGETGSSTVTNGNIINATASSITVARVIAVKKAFDDKDVEAEDRYFHTNTEVLNNMLNLENATSADYVSVKNLIRGDIDTWMGFLWTMTTRLPSTEIGIAWQKYGMCGAGMDGSPMVRTDEREDLSYSWQVYYELNLGFARLEEDRVVLIQEG